MHLIDERWSPDRALKCGKTKIVARQLTSLAESSAQNVSVQDHITVSAKEPHQLFSVASCLEVAARAGHVKDFCGPIRPLISTRWLQWSLAYLKQIDQTSDDLTTQLHHAASSALEMGYNAIFVGEGFGYNRQTFSMDHPQFLKLADSAYSAAGAMNMQFGIDITRFEAKDGDLLRNFFQDHQALSAFHADLEGTFGQREGLLRDERLLLGLKTLRELCTEKTSIIAHLIDDYYGDLKTLTALIARLPCNCQLSFCAIGKSPDQIYGSPHLVWKALRSFSMRGPLPLIPIFNPGQSGWGGGLWPTLPTLEWGGLMQRVVGEKLTSTLALSPQMPRGDSFLRASLWIFGQSQWRSLSMEDLWETWRKGQKSDWRISQRAHQYLLQLSKSLQGLLARKSDGCDLYDITALKSEIALLCLRIPNMVNGDLLLEAVHLFLTDARHLLIAALQEGVGAHQGTQYHALLQTLLQEDGNEMGLWTELRGSGASAKMGWRQTPLATTYRRADQITSIGGFSISNR